MAAIVIASNFTANRLSKYNTKNDTQAIIVGDSHGETAINDKIINNVMNICQGGSAYFYSYLKIKKLLDDNKDINTVVLGYSPQDIEKKRDRWVKDEKYLKANLKKHFHLLPPDDFFYIFLLNPYEVIKSSLSTPLYNLEIFFKNPQKIMNRLGGYLHVTDNKLEKAKEIFNSNKGDMQDGFSYCQIDYLLKIYNLCTNRNIKFVLLCTPVHPLLKDNNMRNEELMSQYKTLISGKMSQAVFIDHSAIQIPQNGYRDLEHLNHVGAKIYSEFLEENRIFALAKNE